MPKYSTMFETSRNGILSFVAEDDNEAIQIYEQLINGDVYPDVLDGTEEETEDSNVSYYELRTGQGKLIAE